MGRPPPDGVDVDYPPTGPSGSRTARWSCTSITV